ncbi:MAG: FkbM family methyltransferase [Streptosporangiaceae bacterium]|jgi:FkbM family methyltransferase
MNENQPHTHSTGPWPLPVRWGLRYLRCAPGRLPGQALLAGLLDRHLERRALSGLTATRYGAVIPVTSSDLIQRYLMIFGTWEPHLTGWLTSRIRPGDTVIDVGANIGYYSLLAACLAGPRGHVIAIEPSPVFCQALASAADANGLHQVRVVQAAASDIPARLSFYQPEPGNLGHTTAVPPRSAVPALFTAQARPLGDLVRPADLAAARIIKIDVEGAEAAVIDGLAPHLNLLRPDADLIIEVSPRLLRRQDRAVTDITGTLSGYGWHPYLITNNYDARSYPAALRRPRPPRRLDLPITRLPDPADLVFSRTDARHL